MTSRSVVLALALVAACTDDVPTLRVSTIAGTSVELAPPDDGIPPEFGHYRWEVSETPDGVVVAPPAAMTATITVTPITRGLYVYDRWFVGDSAAQLSARVIVYVTGARPVARIEGPMTVAVGETAIFDGSFSTTFERRLSTYQWRLALRPELSVATLAAADGETLAFVPDVAGRYKIELRVFDGQVWSVPASASLTVR